MTMLEILINFKKVMKNYNDQIIRIVESNINFQLLVLIFSYCSFIIYMNRYSISISLLHIFENELKGSFVILLMCLSYIIAPICAMKYELNLNIIRYSILFCLLGTIICSCSFGYFNIIFGHIIFSFGEGIFIQLSYVYLIKINPFFNDGLLKIIYFGASILGISMGYIVSGFISINYHWRFVYVFQSVILIFGFWILSMISESSLLNIITENQIDENNKRVSLLLKNYNLKTFFNTFKILFKTKFYFFLMLFEILRNSIVDALAFWLPIYTYRYFNIEIQWVGFIFGLLSLIIGTLSFFAIILIQEKTIEFYSEIIDTEINEMGLSELENETTQISSQCFKIIPYDLNSSNLHEDRISIAIHLDNDKYKIKQARKYYLRCKIDYILITFLVCMFFISLTCILITKNQWVFICSIIVLLMTMFGSLSLMKELLIHLAIKETKEFASVSQDCFSRIFCDILFIPLIGIWFHYNWIIILYIISFLNILILFFSYNEYKKNALKLLKPSEIQVF